MRGQATALPTAALVWLRLSLLRRKAPASLTTVIVERPGAAPTTAAPGPAWLVAPGIEHRMSELRTVVERLRYSVAVGRRRSPASNPSFIDRIIERARTIVVNVPDRSARSGAQPSVVVAASPGRASTTVVARPPVELQPTLAGSVARQLTGLTLPPLAPLVSPARADGAVVVRRRQEPAAEHQMPSPPAVTARLISADAARLPVRALAGAASPAKRPRALPDAPLAAASPFPSRLAFSPAAPAVASVRRAPLAGAALPRLLSVTGTASALSHPSRPSLATTVALERSSSPAAAPRLTARSPHAATTAPTTTPAALPLTPRLPIGPFAAPDAPAIPAAGPPPLVPRRLPHSPAAADALPFLRRREKTVDVRQIQETVTRRIEETLQRRVIENVESAVARELSPDSVLARRLGDRLYTGLVESLVLEKERLGWG